MKMSPPASVPRRVKMGSRKWSHVRLPENSEEPEGETHLQSRTKGPQAIGDGAEAIKEQR